MSMPYAFCQLEGENQKRHPPQRQDSRIQSLPHGRLQHILKNLHGMIQKHGTDGKYLQLKPRQCHMDFLPVKKRLCSAVALKKTVFSLLLDFLRATAIAENNPHKMLIKI